MESKDQIIMDLYMSSKSFIDFYSKILMPKLKEVELEQVKIKNLNQQIQYNFELLYKALNNKLWHIFYVKKNSRNSKSYEQVYKTFPLLSNNNRKGNNQQLIEVDFLKKYLQLKEDLICSLAKHKNTNLDNFKVSHELYGFLTYKELIHLIVSSNYQYIAICKKSLVHRLDIAV